MASYPVSSPQSTRNRRPRLCLNIILLLNLVLCECNSTGLSLQRDRLAACAGIGYVQNVKGLSYIVGSFRANPLPEALLPAASNATVSTQRVNNLTGYIWTLLPYFMLSGILIATLLMVCPCCCAFICFSKHTHRSPSVRVTGIGFSLTFALLSLFAVVAVIVAFQEHSQAVVAYSQAKCAFYSTVDNLVNGVPLAGSRPSQGTNHSTSFVGFRRLKDAITSASISFPDVRTSIKSIKQTFTQQASGVHVVNLAQAYISSWNASHRTAMQGTTFRCSLCEGESLQPLVDAVGDYRNATSVLGRLFQQADADMADSGPMMQSMEIDILNDVTALYRACFNLGSRLQSFIPAWERWLSLCKVGLHVLLAGTLVCIGFGLLATLVCKTESCALWTWWFAYAMTLALLSLFAVLFSTTVVVSDAAGTLRSVVTTPGIETYRRSLFQNLSTWQGFVLSNCINQGGDLRKNLNFSVSLPEMQQWQTLDRTLQDARKARLDESSLNDFFKAHARIDGGTYRAVWNTSQTLAWHSETTGVLAIANSLKNLSGEHWTFHGAQPPVGCAAAVDFKPSLSVLSWSCFFVTGNHPSDAEVKSRYQTLAKDKLHQLQLVFQEARQIAAALLIVQTFAITNAKDADSLSNAWQTSVHIVNRALAESLSDVAAPLELFSSRVTALNSGGNCEVVSKAYLASVQILGQNFVASHLVLTGCSGILALCGMGFSVLYCLLWSIRQEGREYSFQLVSSDAFSDSEYGSDSDNYMQDEVELELRRPLKQSR